MVEAMTTALTAVKTDATAMVAAVLPLALAIFAVKWVPVQGIRFFKQASK